MWDWRFIRTLRSTADFKGRKVRSTGPAADVFSKMGATQVSTPGAELYQGLQTGVVEGAHWGSFWTGWGMNLHEVDKSIFPPDPMGHVNGEVIVGLENWNTIGPDQSAQLFAGSRG